MDIMENIIDLDLLRPKKKIVKLAGKEIDVSFIPCGITFEIDSFIREINLSDKEQLLQGGEETKRIFDATIKLCSTFCKIKYPEMNEEWFRSNVSPEQVQILAEAIQESLLQGYKAVEEYSKNLIPTKEEMIG